jgi:NADH-quinone oxidoreductase subunit E
MNLKPETLDEIEAIIPRYPQLRSALLPVLHAVQRDLGYLSNEAIEWIARKLELQPIQVYEVVTFYPYFRQKPVGRHLIRLCRTLPCALCGSVRIAQAVERAFGCKFGDTSTDGLVTLEYAECLASCGTGPVMLVDELLYEKLTDEKVETIARQLRENAAIDPNS